MCSALPAYSRRLVVRAAALRKGMYVIGTCQRIGRTLQALTVHIEYRHPRRTWRRS
jgi:hypothetical protein